MLFIDYTSQNDLIAWSVWIIYFATAKLLFYYYGQNRSSTFLLQLVHASASVIVEYYNGTRRVWEQERDMRIARGAIESSSNLLSALQTSKCFFMSWYKHSWRDEPIVL